MSRACWIIFLSLAIMSLALPARALVKHRPTVAELDQFKVVDRDQNGRISKKEAEKHWKTYPDLWDGYGAVDGNRDGWWSVNEVWGMYPGTPIFWW